MEGRTGKTARVAGIQGSRTRNRPAARSEPNLSANSAKLFLGFSEKNRLFGRFFICEFMCVSKTGVITPYGIA